ncbi:transcriptional pleiotropic regulator of transition state genes [Cohnella thailandensis]|uniref:AbrB/MazE/SpoVT family DNA-binding domain-containing protein n=1 Tax=Cohnella thailandensis TaxID=557557 RepID=A0A841SSA0_9BACL|nr:AbrB/MazE/SpoVT family DNA-binding domain-containing protein [Cohnella thailandensis]MBB6632790.1 AbrB/MazE/SpoVT family DNA-binding domain-containing protein [Cohnella thailandensis]MBP1975519.1 transcriptional pleiotropic regulator of transition state genes [Cohnella thailandensis]
MKATGITRKVDELGRIVLPKELRRTMGINEKDPIEIFVHGETIVLRKYAPGCTFCGNEADVQIHFNKPICSKCVQDIGRKARA